MYNTYFVKFLKKNLTAENFIFVLLKNKNFSDFDAKIRSIFRVVDLFGFWWWKK